MRDPQRVAVDVRNRYATREAAERVYGVVLGARFEVDEEATARAREARRS